MKNGKYQNGKSAFNVRPIAIMLAVALLIGVSIGGTIAWLTAQTPEVKNTFTDSDISIDLDETTTNYKMIPGWTIDKDPYITVEANSEDCYLFVEVTESTNLDNYIAYRVNQSTAITTAEKKLSDEETITVTHGGWSVGTGTDEGKNGVPTNVYFRKVSQDTANSQYFAVLGGVSHGFENVEYPWTDDQVLVLPSVTKQMMDELETDGATQPTLTFKAYAVQLFKTNDNGDAADTTDEFTVAEAWAKAAALNTQN